MKISFKMWNIHANGRIFVDINLKNVDIRPENTGFMPVKCE